MPFDLVGLPFAVMGGGLLLASSVRKPSLPLSFKGLDSPKWAGVLPNSPFNLKNGAGLLCGKYMLGNFAELGAYCLGSRR